MILAMVMKVNQGLIAHKIRIKKQKNESSSSVDNPGCSFEPAAMQIALTPFRKGVDVKQFLQDRKKRTEGLAPATSTAENSLNLGVGIPLLVGVRCMG
jgi:hypothetical protein